MKSILVVLGLLLAFTCSSQSYDTVRALILVKDTVSTPFEIVTEGGERVMITWEKPFYIDGFVVRRKPEVCTGLALTIFPENYFKNLYLGRINKIPLPKKYIILSFEEY